MTKVHIQELKFTTDLRNNSMSQRLSCGLGDVASVFNCAGGLYVNGYSTFHDTSLHVYSYVYIYSTYTKLRNVIHIRDN